VATVSHELRTPITSIRGFVELLLDASSELTESQMRMLQTIERNAEQLQRVARTSWPTRARAAACGWRSPSWT